LSVIPDIDHLFIFCFILL